MTTRIGMCCTWIALAILTLGVGCKSDDDSKDSSDDAGMDAGSEPLVPPLELGEAITAPDKEWTWVPFSETRCMNDTPTGLGIRLNKASDKVIIVIQGGGACFNTATCFAVINANGFGSADLAANTSAGLLSIDDVDNPFKDWNMVFVPYCSGDIFSGNAPNKTGFGGRTQIGYKNFQEYLKRLVPTFRHSSHVVLNGYSAGGFAASINWVQAREAWGEDMRVDVLNDSGPTMGPKYLSTCMQQRLAKTWNWAAGTIPEGCKDCDIATGNVTEPAIKWSIPHTLKGRHGLISSDEDSVIKQFFGFGLNNCANFDTIGTTFPAGLYPQGLADLRTTFKDHPGAAEFIVKSTNHVWTLMSPGKVTSNGVVLRDWIEDFLDPDAKFESVVP